MKANKYLISELKENYKKAVMAYISVFEEKQDVIFEGWVGSNFGEVAYFGDVPIPLDVVMCDINMNVPKGLYLTWYDILSMVSYKSWLSITHGIKIA